MLKYVKEGALDLLALWPSSLLESIRQVSEDDFLSPHLSHKQRQPRLRRRNSPNTGLFASKAIAPRQRHHPTHEHYTLNRDLARSRQLDLADRPSKPSIQLPYEMLVLIFRHLPASDLFSMLAVNRQWRQIALLETKQIDLSECFPVDCLGLENEEYSDFDFVYNLFSIFPLISSLVIKDRYMRDRDLRVVTAGILAGKMAFTHAGGPPVGSEEYESARRAVAERRHQRMQLEQQEGAQAADSTAEGASVAPSTRSTVKVMDGTIQQELREFSKSVGTYVLIPQTRNTLRKKILERLEHNLELKEIQEYCWMMENGIDPDACLSSPVTAAVFASTPSSSTSGTSSPDSQKRYPLVPMSHYRFQDCCFANDWGAIMDVNKLPMIGLAAAISRQGLVVDLEGSYGAPSKSIRTMLGFCFGAHCVLSLEFNFRHTHMELQHVTELLSENAILYKVDIVDSPAYHDLIRLPALRGLGSFLERMHDACLDVDERVLEETLQGARLLLQEIERDVTREEHVREEWEARPKLNKARSATASSPSYITPRPPLDDHSRPIESLSKQLTFPGVVSFKDKFRTAKVLLKGVLHHGMVGLVNTRDRHSGQSLLHALAWKRSYASLVALAMNSAWNGSIGLSATPPPPHFSRQCQNETLSALSSSYPPRGGFWSTSQGYFSSSPPPSAPSSSTAVGNVADEMPLTHVYEQEAVGGWVVIEEPTSLPVQESQPTSTSALSSLMSISSLPAALNNALSFRRMSLPVSTLWIPGDSEDIGVGEGTLPTLENDDETDVEDGMASTAQGSVDRVEERAKEDKGSPVMAAPGLGLTSAASVIVVPEQHPAAIALRMAKTLLEMKASPNVYNKDGRSAVVCASYMGFQPMETLLVEHGGYSKELIRIRETM
ncbi:hypothetical protein BGZ70_009290 [Mortierella alpina]|uniref:F-box domain-containing protein n=1 Tax=Mortierella alpina TaxID=64518 RepID=A0A9P6J1T1_MORAP|nr:hypothetical protein BGZ70_009290 [Mortierella alpina]